MCLYYTKVSSQSALARLKEAVVGYLALQLLQRIFVPSGKNPAPTRDTEHSEHLKHVWCHWCSSNEMYFPSPKPEEKSQRDLYVKSGLYNL